MKADKQTSKHLLLAVVNTVFSIILILTIIVMSWEPWMVPLVAAGCVGVWVLHISRSDQAKLYENLSTGLMLVEFLFFGAHSASLFDVPAVACIIVFVFSMLDRKRLLYITAALYVTVLLYHCLILHTVVPDMQAQEVMRLVLGGVVVFGSVGVARYRVDRRLAEQQRYTRVLEQLETSGRENVVLLSNVSHEFRTPINMVMGISEIILEKDIPPEIREDIKSIQLAGKRLSNHISNILDYTEIAEGSLTPAQEEYMITSVLMDVVTTTAIQSAKHQLELVFDIDPDVPAVLVGDAEKITHVMKALLENSIKFTEEGGISVSIGYRQEIYGVNLLIDIIDTGIGMTAAQLTQMYDDFYQADSGSSRFAGGLGLGIPIVRGLLHAMGGFIHFESLGQQGLQAHISIPQGVADDSPSLSLAHADELCVACYFRPEKYNSDEVRRFYDKLIVHLVEGLGIEGYQAHNFEGLLKLQRSHPLTHIVIAQAEYEENRCYYEELTNKLRVVIIAEKDYVLDRNSRLLVIRKPFSAISVVNLFNGEVEENGFKEAQAVGDRPFTCEGVRVLVVDDEEMNLVVAKGVLGSYGIQVDICLSGKEALELCVSNRYDIIFLDHMMPGFDGVETLRRIREMRGGVYQDLPVIALTANTISGAREMFRSEGFTEFIPKPIERTVLERVLHKILPPHCIRYIGGPSEKEFPEEEAVPAGSLQEKEPPEEKVESSAPEETEAPAGSTALPYAQLVQAGINVDKGLDYCCGEEDFYLEMLQIFYAQGKEKMEEITALYEAANWKDYATKVHALKSTSLTIGAEQLSEHAKALEQAGKNGDVEYIKKHHPGLLRLYQEVCNKIAGL